MNSATINNLYERKFLSELDYRFARFLGRLDGSFNDKFLLAASLVSRKRREGHTCVDLSMLAATVFDHQDPDSLICPSLEEWLNVLERSPVVGRPGDYKPIILNGARLYLYRYWDYEKRLADALKVHAGLTFEASETEQLQNSFKRIFPSNDQDEKTNVDWRKVAAFVSIRKGLCVISGGPGTGKTFAVARILAILIEQNRHGQLKIALTAPTGKAVTRLQESIRKAKPGLNCHDSVKASIPDEASTIHRLLGAIPNTPSCRFNKENPLPFDVVIIDEASMVDLSLFSRLVQAAKPQSRIILLGDKDQLASVEAGSVLGDICDTGTIHHFSFSLSEECKRVTDEEIGKDRETSAGGMNDCIIQLTKNYRFSKLSGIHAVSQTVNTGNGKQAIDLIRGESFSDICWRNLPRSDELPSNFENWIMERYTAYMDASDPLEAFDLFNSSRILSALRDGPYGVYNLNVVVEYILQKKGHIDPRERWYHGRPIMITKNDYRLRLFNGDIGITMVDHTKQTGTMVFFTSPDGSVRCFPPLRLPDHETVYAMTVHKSQGSEFDDVLFVLPDRDTPVLTRELIYTAITRAKEKIQIWGKEDIFLTAVARRIQRSSGLRDALWDNPAA